MCLSCHLGGLLEEGEIRGGKDESTLDFLQSGGRGRLERGLVNATLTDPKDTETGNPNSLSNLYLPVLSLVNGGRQILKKSSMCFKRPEGGGVLYLGGVRGCAQP